MPFELGFGWVLWVNLFFYPSLPKNRQKKCQTCQKQVEIDPKTIFGAYLPQRRVNYDVFNLFFVFFHKNETQPKPNSKGTFLPLNVNSSIFHLDFLLDFCSCDLRNVILSSKEQKSSKKSEWKLSNVKKIQKVTF